MEKDNTLTPFTRAMMTGLFVGIIDTVVCLTYNVLYRDSTGYSPSAIINVSSLIFAVNIVLLLLGIVYYLFRKFFRNGDIPYVLVFSLLTAWLLWKSLSVHRFDDGALNAGFRGLLSGVVLIMGLSASFLLPFLYHNRKFEEKVL